MKRLIMLAVLCAFVLSAASASAADIKASGDWAIEGIWKSNWNFDKNANDPANLQRFAIEERATTTFEFIANENLKGVLVTRYGTANWGQDAFAIGRGDSNTAGNAAAFRIRRVYVDFNWPDTTINVKAGYQGVTLPNAFGGGSLILSEEVGAAIVSGQITDNVSYLLGYARAFSGGASEYGLNEVDGYVAALPLAFEGFSITPFGMYAPIGKNVTAGNVVGAAGTRQMMGLAATNASAQGNGDDFDNAYWLGAAFTMDLFDPFVLKADLNYGKVDSKYAQNRRSGWLGDIALEYKGFDFMTPEAFFVYTSGEDGNASKGNGSSERMPGLAAGDWAIGSFFFGGDRLLDGSMADRNAYLGFWALGLSLKDIASFAEGLSHDAHFIYAKGTNSKDVLYKGIAVDGTTAGNYNIEYGRTLTEDDSLFEVDFNTGYKLYDELTLSLDLGYLKLSTKESRWDNTKGYKGGSAWKVSTGVAYSF